MPKTLTINIVTVGDNGDSSVGISGSSLDLDFKGMEIDEDQLEELRADIKSLFFAWNPNGFSADYCTFDFEEEEEEDFMLFKEDEELLMECKRFEEQCYLYDALGY